jgi:hypothetical protein
MRTIMVKAVFDLFIAPQAGKSGVKGYTGTELHDLHVPFGTSSTVCVIGCSGPFVGWTGIADGDANLAGWYSIAAHPGIQGLF